MPNPAYILALYSNPANITTFGPNTDTIFYIIM